MVHALCLHATLAVLMCYGDRWAEPFRVIRGHERVVTFDSSSGWTKGVDGIEGFCHKVRSG